MLKDWLLDLYDYTCWGRDKMLDTAALLTAEQFDQETRFPIHTAKETLVHTMSAEFAYRMRCNGLRYQNYTKDQFADVAALRAQWQAEEALMRTYLAEVGEADLQSEVTYWTPAGEEVVRVRLALLNQLFLHSMQHRAEVAQMLTEFGHSPGNIDYVVFVDEGRSKYHKAHQAK
jgi:uncharacterized damage-inducible protein DinB